jgi:hypothetical protein
MGLKESGEDSMKTIINFIRSRIRFDRNELSGAFGDIGTDLPLIIGMVASSGINGAGVFVVFGLMQVATALIYGIPMPVQPLKAVALIVITQKIGGDILYGGGLAIGLVMFFLAITGILDRLGRIIPLAVVRGIQMGLGLQLSMLALKEYIPSNSTPGFILAGTAFVITLLLIGNRRFPPALPVMVMGAIYGFIYNYDPSLFSRSSTLFFQGLPVPSFDSLLTGFLVLAIPQIPLSLGNSVFASSRIIADYFPEKQVPVRKIGFTYALMNLIGPFFGGIPVCHGSGGLAGHYAFGARTGGSIVIYGSLFVLVGLFSGGNVSAAAAIFPKPVLGVILLFEGISLLNLMRDMAPSKNNFVITVLVALAAVCLPFGYLIGMASGTALYYLHERRIIGIADPIRVGR